MARRPAGYYFTLDSFGRVPTYLNGTQVHINGKPAPLLYTSFSQINAIVPYEIEGQRAATVQALCSLASLEHSRRARGSRHFHARLGMPVGNDTVRLGGVVVVDTSPTKLAMTLPASTSSRLVTAPTESPA